MDGGTTKVVISIIRLYALDYIHFIQVSDNVIEYLKTGKEELIKEVWEELRKIYREKVKGNNLWGTVHGWNDERIVWSLVWYSTWISNASWAYRCTRRILDLSF